MGTSKKGGHGVKYFEHWKKTNSILGYSTQQIYHSKLKEERNLP
jgi:hypothetical protein